MMTERGRCEVTNNPCGTDTWAVGHPCQCSECQKYLADMTDPTSPVAAVLRAEALIAAKQAEIERLRKEVADWRTLYIESQKMLLRMVDIAEGLAKASRQ
jgi:queuine/archaeosine tRNA-ribosyltransferase